MCQFNMWWWIAFSTSKRDSQSHSFMNRIKKLCCILYTNVVGKNKPNREREKIMRNEKSFSRFNQSTKHSILQKYVLQHKIVLATSMRTDTYLYYHRYSWKTMYTIELTRIYIINWRDVLCAFCACCSNIIC